MTQYDSICAQQLSCDKNALKADFELVGETLCAWRKFLKEKSQTEIAMMIWLHGKSWKIKKGTLNMKHNPKKRKNPLVSDFKKNNEKKNLPAKIGEPKIVKQNDYIFTKNY